MILLLALWGADALAFAPVDGPPGLEDRRVLRTDPHTQARLGARPAWEDFLSGEGAGWQARFDQDTGTPHRMWGPPIALGPVETPDQVAEALLAFVDRHPDLLGATSARLQVRSVERVASTDTWYVDLDVLAGGMPIHGGGITARIRGGGLVLLGADTYPGLAVQGARRMARGVARTRALAAGPLPSVPHLDVREDLVAVPLEREGILELRPAWRVRSRTAAPHGLWETWVDADSGELLGARDRIRYLAGAVDIEHDARTVDGATTVSPGAHLRITDGDTTTWADAEGLFEVPGATWTASLRSPWFTVLNETGPEGSLTSQAEAEVFTNAHATAAERSTIVFLHRIREWQQRVAPDVDMEVLTARVNHDQTCNAYFDGDLNFFQAGDGCNNTGRIADVVFHEWGHGFHYFSLKSGDFDGSLSEGAADTVAFLQTADPEIAPHFSTDGTGIRDVAPNQVYPDDYVANELYVHSNGLIFGGAMWDLWGMLVDELGEEEGTRELERIFVGLLKGGPTVETSFEEALFADDDDGDLGNGTPNECALLEAFGAHGLGPLGKGTTFLVHHDPADPHPAEAIEADLIAASERCFPFAPSSAEVTWRVDGGSWQTAALELDGNTVRGQIPESRAGAFVEYYLTVRDEEGDGVTAPEGATINPFSYYVGDVLPVHCDDFEHTNGDWTHDLVSGQEREGADDWMWGAPRGMSGDPSVAASGERVWGNDLGGGQYNGAHQDDVHNRLVSPPLSTRHYRGTFLSYQRWLNVEDGFYDRARILADDAVVWENWATTENNGVEHHRDVQWAPHVVSLEGQADDGEVQIAFEIESDAGLAMGGWNVDDVCLFAPDTPDNRLGISDFVARGDGEEAITLSWTQPIHAPVERVVVVRRRGRLPEGPEDGDVVYEDDAPEPGAVVEVVDDDVRRRPAYHYAVYASDGSHWLSWTVDGWNADVASVVGDPEARGCTTTPVAPGLLLTLLAALGARRRRR